MKDNACFNQVCIQKWTLLANKFTKLQHTHDVIGKPCKIRMVMRLSRWIMVQLIPDLRDAKRNDRLNRWICNARQHAINRVNQIYWIDRRRADKISDLHTIFWPCFANLPNLHLQAFTIQLNKSLDLH
ncbi:hypothetical protein D3C71_1731480 [compost metagenome]